MKTALRLVLFLVLIGGTHFSLQAQETKQIISKYLQDHASDWKLEPSDVSSIEIVSTASSLNKEAKHYYIRQLKNNWPVVNGLASVTVKNGQVVYVAPSLVSLKSENTAAPVLSAEDAVKKAFATLGLPEPNLVVISENKTEQSVIFEKTAYTNENIPVRLFLEHINGKLEYVWDLSVYPTGTTNWWSMRLSAVDGTELFRNNWFVSCSAESCSVETHQHATSAMAPPPPPPGMNQYGVYALPAESPNHGNKIVVTDPADATFSPFGWHDTNGADGAEHTITRGNNVYAYDDIDDDNAPGYSPDGGTDLDFDFPYDSLLGPSGNLDVIVTNLFYMNNMIHDIWGHYGFDEESGNFQETNYTGTNGSGDGVMAEAQDGSGTDNANFATPPDGQNPRMQMYLWGDLNGSTYLVVNDPDSLSGGYQTGTATFGPDIPVLNPITEDLVLVIDDGADTTDACNNILNGPSLNGKIALVRRGNCTNVSKVQACEALGAIAVVVINTTDPAPGTMSGTVPANDPIEIPSCIISKSDGDAIVASLNAGATVNITLNGLTGVNAFDSDLDNGVIAHEYGHGMSNRLVGGSGNANCMWNDEQLGEGWSDWLALIVTMNVGDQGGDRRGMGTYLIGESTLGTGIRPAPYSTNPSFNNYKLGHSNAMTGVHDRGFIWATMLWDLTWDLIDEEGYDPNLTSGTGGNNIAMALVIEGMKQTACNSGFESARDGILAADQLLYAGEYECLIWNAFAERGLGWGASSGDEDVADDQIEDFTVPVNCLSGLTEMGISTIYAFPNPGTGQVTVNLSNCKNAQQLVVTDLTGKIINTRKLSGDKEVLLDLSDVTKGIYLIRVTDGNGTHVIEWVKQ